MASIDQHEVYHVGRAGPRRRCGQAPSDRIDSISVTPDAFASVVTRLR
jgi:hypothetical protein